MAEGTIGRESRWKDVLRWLFLDTSELQLHTYVSRFGIFLLAVTILWGGWALIFDQFGSESVFHTIGASCAALVLAIDVPVSTIREYLDRRKRYEHE